MGKMFHPIHFSPNFVSAQTQARQRQTTLGTITCAQVNMIHFLTAEWQMSKCQAVISTTKSSYGVCVCTCVKEHFK